MSPRPPPRLHRRAWPLLALALASAGCANTKVSRVWADPALEEHRFQRTMVLVAVPSFGRRQSAEDRIVAELGRQGVAAVRSWDVLPHEDVGDRERIRAAVAASGVDALLAVRLTSAEQDRQVAEGREQWVPIGTGIDSFGYVSSAYGLYRKPEVYDLRVFTIETTLWDVAAQRMVWACQSDSETADQTITTAELADDYARVVGKRVVPYLKAR
jgi:hypothetical protein